MIVIGTSANCFETILTTLTCFCVGRWNLTANAARPNPQGSYHYGTIPLQRTLILANSETKINGSLRYAVNSVSYVNPATPLKLADYYNISGVFKVNSIKDRPLSVPAVFGTSVIGTTLHDFIEIVFQNNETTIQSWHLDGYSFWIVGYASILIIITQNSKLSPWTSIKIDLWKFRYGNGIWTSDMRKRYNLADAGTRHTVQVIENFQF